MSKAEKFALLAVELLENGDEYPFQTWGAFRAMAKKESSRFEAVDDRERTGGLRFVFDDGSAFAFWHQRAANGASFVALNGVIIFKSNPED